MLTKTKTVRKRMEVPVEQVLEEKRKIEAELQKQKEEAAQRERDRREKEKKEREERQRKKKEVNFVKTQLHFSNISGALVGHITNDSTVFNDKVGFEAEILLFINLL